MRKKNRYRDILSRMTGGRIIVLGDLMLDEYLWGSVTRISPEAPIPVVDVQRVSFAPGGAGNVAANIVSLGGQAELFGVLGADEAGERLRAELESRGIGLRGLLVDPERPTTLKTRVVAHSQQVVRVDREVRQPLPARLAQGLMDILIDSLPGADALLISDYAKGMVQPSLLERLIPLATAAQKPVVVDPKGSDYTRYRGATLVSPNSAEAAQAARIALDQDRGPLEAGKVLLEQLASQAVLITAGEKGMWLFEAAGGITHLPSRAREVYDVTGAGDTVVGTLVLALASGATLIEAAHIANYAAGLVVSKVGTATVERAELEKALMEV